MHVYNYPVLPLSGISILAELAFKEEGLGAHSKYFFSDWFIQLDILKFYPYPLEKTLTEKILFNPACLTSLKVWLGKLSPRQS
jgi:hypothetical protein